MFIYTSERSPPRKFDVVHLVTRQGFIIIVLDGPRGDVNLRRYRTQRVQNQQDHIAEWDWHHHIRSTINHVHISKAILNPIMLIQYKPFALMRILPICGWIGIVVLFVQCDDVIAWFRSCPIDQNLVELGLFVATGRWVL